MISSIVDLFIVSKKVFFLLIYQSLMKNPLNFQNLLKNYQIILNDQVPT